MPAAEGGPRTLYDKVFQDHIVDERLDGTILLYIGTSDYFYIEYYILISCVDRHLVHEVTSPVCCPALASIWGRHILTLAIASFRGIEERWPKSQKT